MKKIFAWFWNLPRRYRKLDLEFYRSTYADLSHLENSDLENHWNTFGRKEKRFPNRERLNSSWQKKGLPKIFDFEVYNFTNFDLNFESEIQAKVHYLHFGINEKREIFGHTKRSNAIIVRYFVELFKFLQVEELKQTEDQLAVEKLLQIFTLDIKNIYNSSETYFGGGNSQRERLVNISEWMLQHTPAPTDLVNLINHAEVSTEKQRTTITIEQAEFLACLKWGLYSDILTHFVPELSADRFKIGKYDVNILGTRNVFNFRNKLILNSLNVVLQFLPNLLKKILNVIHQTHSQSHSLSKPQISLIASIFNGDKFLEKFIKNIVELNNFENMELLIIDSNSTNPIQKKLLPYLKKHPNIKILRLEEPNTIYESWNMAIKIASGEYISNVNVDDQRLKPSVFDQARFLDLNLDVDIVYGNYVYSFAPNTPLKSALKMQIKTEFPPLTTHNLLEFNSPHCAPMWRKSLHPEIGYFDESLKSAADWEFWLRCANSGKIFACLEDPIAIYFFNQNGISTNPNSPSISEQWKIRRKYRQMLINETKIIGSLVS